MKLCKVEGCNNPVWGKEYCKNHQYLRKDISRSISKKPIKAIRKFSVKRNEQNKDYLLLKEEAVAEGRKKGHIICFFCNKKIQGIPDWHHLDGREEDKLTDTDKLVFVHRKCHSNIHNMSYDHLSLLPCYNGYLDRLRAIAEYLYLREYEKRHKT